jgi:hypothetical protein
VPLLQGYAAQLEAAARRAWDWLAANPSRIPSSYDNAGFASASAEDDAYWQQMNRLRAAVWLFRRTGDPAWRSFFDAGHAAAHLFVWGWASPWEHEFQDAWLAYATTPGATPSVAAAIRSAYAAQLGGAQHLGRATSGADAYRAWLPDADHTWGSNRTKALQWLMFVAMNRAGLDVARAGAYTAAAEDYLHYLHGVNPPGFSFLTNMRAFGGEGSVDETYHTWFADGTVWDNARTSLYGPAPGIVTGGANPSYRPAPEYLGPRLAPPLDQPILKAYRDWNANWPENSWEVTESHIPQQAAYVRLVAEFATGAPAVLGLSVPLALAPGTTAVFRVGGAGPGSLVALLWSTAPGSFRITTAAWALDLGLQVFLPPHLHILFLGVADGSGGATWSLAIPPGFPSMAFWFQASQVTGPYPVQSAVMVGRS